jgi:predicted lipid-binding transport protein (Tim44 family)
MSRFKTGNLGAIALGLSALVMLTAPDDADARRRGSFGSRGARTYDAPATTAVAPRQTAPVQRSMTEKSAGTSAQARGAASARSGGMGRGLIGGLIAGGLIGALLGGGLGSLAGAGMLMALLQVALIGGIIWFLFRMFRRSPSMAGARSPSLAGAHGGAMPSPFTRSEPRDVPSPAPFGSFGGGAAAAPSHDIAINDADRQTFERLLIEVQDAFGKEDYARLRERTTPEVMSYFAEELSQNATQGRRNDVIGTELIDAEVSEAWREGSTDYATIAMRYEGIDVMRDRSSGAVVEGDPSRPTQATELWTFKREPQGQWRLSAIQEA